MGKETGFQVKGSGAEIYEHIWVPALMGKCADDLIAASEIKSGDRVLDVACGTGVVARRALSKCLPGGSVVGADVNEPMLSAAKQIAADEDLNGIAWRQCDAIQMPFADASFDVALCQQGLQFMPDRDAALQEIWRVLRPDGRLAISVWKEASPFSIVLGEVLDRHFGEGITAPWMVASSLGDRDELRTLAKSNGFEGASIRLDVPIGRHAEPEQFVAGAILGSPLAATFESADEAKQRTIVQEIVSGISDHMDDEGLAITTKCHTLTARKRATVL